MVKLAKSKSSGVGRHERSVGSLAEAIINDYESINDTMGSVRHSTAARRPLKLGGYVAHVLDGLICFYKDSKGVNYELHIRRNIR